MFKVILILLLSSLPLNASLFDIFNLGKWFNKTNTELKDIKTGINDTKAGINDVNLKLGDLETKIDTNIKLTGQLQTKIATLDKSINTNISSGRDTITTTTTTNESGLLKYIFKILSGIFASLTVLMWKIIKNKNKLIEEERKLFFKRLEEKDVIIREKDKFIEKILINMSDDWKEMFMLLKGKNDTDSKS